MSGLLPDKWDMESEVVVVGYGAAGAVAAINAHDAGAKVTVLEKMKQGGGNSRVSGGNIIVPQSRDFAKYLNVLSFNTTEPETIDLFVDSAMKHGDWIKEIGGDFTVYRPLQVAYPMAVAGAGFPQVPGSQHMLKYNIKGEPEIPPAQRLWDLLSRNVEKRGIKVMTETPARELVKNEKGEVIGVIAESKGKKIAINTKRGVILTCGGYENNEAIKWDNLPCKPVKFVGNPGNTGDGLKMAAKIGAELWHMTCLSCVIGFQSPDYEAAFFVIFLDPGFIFVDKHGKRFVDESGLETHEMWRPLSYYDTHRLEYPRIPMYAIFDEQTRKRAPLNGSTAGYNARHKLYKWSMDNSEEIKKGWIVQAKSVTELASKLKMEPENLEVTMANFNKNAKTGADPEFNRAKEHIRSIDGPPFYAIPLYPGVLNTQGGPRRDKDARVVDVFGKPIPRLYAAGEIGSIWGFLYQGANNLGECIVFGRIAGKNAAAEKPWS